MLGKRAVWSLIGSPGKTIILIITCVVIGTIVLSSLAIQAGVIHASQLAREQLGNEVILEFNYDKALQKRPRGQGVTELDEKPVRMSMADSLIMSPYIKGYNYLKHHFMFAGDFDYIQSIRGAELPQSPNVALHEVLETGLLSHFTNGIDVLLEGRHIKIDDRGELVVLLERRLAELNELQLNDMITISTKGGQEFTFLIVGIYETSSSGVQPLYGATTIPSNKIYASFGGMISNDIDESDIIVGKAIYYLNDPLHIDLFIEEAKEVGQIDFELFRLSANDKAYDEMTGAISQVASISSMMQLLIVLAGTAILSLILMLSTRSRVAEIGILLSLGESRLKIIGQLLIELVIIIGIAFSLSFFASKLFADDLGSRIISQQVSSMKEQRELYASEAVFAVGVTVEEPIEAIKIRVTFDNLTRLGMIGICIGFVSIAIPALLIMRLKPREILTKAT